MKELYFAYGSNLLLSQMQRRCPGSAPVTAARLKGWRWLIGERGYATIAPAARGVIHGALYTLTERDVARLDINEGVSKGCYGKFRLEVEIPDQSNSKKVQTVHALTYIDPRIKHGEPSHAYLRRCVHGADEWDLPESMVEKMLKFAPKDFLGA